MKKISITFSFFALTLPMATVIACGSSKKITNDEPKPNVNETNNNKKNNKKDETNNEKNSENKDDDTKPDSKVINEEGVVFKNVGALLSEDKYWNISGLRYGKKTHIAHGSSYYVNKDKTSWNRLSLDDWFDTYDTTYENILNDKYHKYNNYGVPKEYDSKLIGTTKIYATSKNDRKLESRQGNNANSFRGIYSGDRFYMYNGGRKAHVEDTAEMVDNKKFITIKKKDGTSTPTGTISYSRYYNNWEHVSPATMEAGSFGASSRDSYNESQWPREFAQSTGDLHNLRPSWAGVNQPRSNYPFGIVKGEAKSSDNFGNIDFEIGKLPTNNISIAEPRVNIRGDIARIMFFMHDRYHVTYDKDYYKLMLLWAKMDPITESEKALDNEIAKVMGYHNDYITGDKKLPFYQEVEQRVINANEETNAKIYKITTK